MLQEAHKALEAMHKASNSLKMEPWGEAERALVEVQETVGGCCARSATRFAKRSTHQFPKRVTEVSGRPA